MISFGPVPSRRLGKSLGINNIVSPKTCSYSCVYCQVGRTRVKSAQRSSFYKPELIYEKVTRHLEKLADQDYPDYLTFVSNGEPTLDANLGKSINLLKKTGLPVAVISNASMLFYESARDDLSLADWISLKMDASASPLWRKVNKPSPELNFRKHINGIIKFSSMYSGTLNTETMVVRDLNDTTENFNGLADIISEVNPSTAYLSVPTRPPAEKTVRPPDSEKLNLAWNIFNERNIKTELLTGFEGTDAGYTGNIYEDILNITAVHPIREDTMAGLLEKDKAYKKVFESLIRQRLISETTFRGKKFYIREYNMNI
ncbi:MAG: radical SAM protein [Bacteroidales bacterium]|nr:radical SAM protein [Bacteroidales bacterium]